MDFNKSRNNKLSEIEMFVTLNFGISVQDLRSKSRKYSKARFVAFYLIQKHLDYSLPKIGQLFSMDHSSVSNGINRVIEYGWSKGIDELFAKQRSKWGQPVDKV